MALFPYSKNISGLFLKICKPQPGLFTGYNTVMSNSELNLANLALDEVVKLTHCLCLSIKKKQKNPMKRKSRSTKSKEQYNMSLSFHKRALHSELRV